MSEVRRYRNRYPELEADAKHRRSLRRISWGAAIICVALVGVCIWIVLAAQSESISVVEDPFPTGNVWSR